MHKTLIASTLAISVALSGISATPARADDDLAKILAGTAAVLIIGAAINKSNRDKRTSRARARERERIRVEDRPRRCLRRKYQGRRWVEFYDKQCLKGQNRRVDKPRICLRQRWTPNGWVKYYERSCLRRAGYETAARRHHDDD